MDLVEATLVMFVFRQFFQLSWRRDAWRLLLAGLAYVAFKTVLVRLFSWAVIKLVLAQLA
jgi:hypothetical protein